MDRRNFGLLLLTAAALPACVPAGSVDTSSARPAVPAGKALVVFYRPASFAGGAIRFNVNHAEGFVGQLTSGTVLYKMVDPGPQTFWAQVISQDAITVDAQAGQTYYVRGTVKMGLYAGRPTFQRVSEAVAQSEMSGG